MAPPTKTIYRPLPDAVDVFLARFRPHCDMPTEYLLSRAALDSLPCLYSQERVADPTVYVKFFDPTSRWTWYATEADVERDEEGFISDVMFFGWVDGDVPELGYFTLRELGSSRGRFGMPVERDLHFTPRSLSTVRAA